MAFNLQEYILFRTELGRELFNAEVDTNFKMVANPWVNDRVYDEGNIVYHPVEVDPATGSSGSTGGDNQALAWWRANQRTTLGVFDTNEWDLIGGIGTGDITIGAQPSFGKIRVNYTGSIGSWQAGNDALLSAPTPDSTVNLVAGSGMSLQYDQSTNSIRLINTGSQGEVNQGINIGTGLALYAGMVGLDLSFRGLGVSGTSSPALTISLDGVNNNVNYRLDEGAINLSNLNGGQPTLDLLYDVNYIGIPANNDILQWNSSTGKWRNVSLSSSGAQGPTGAPGATGPAGATGAIGFGATGATGATGSIGFTGATGSGATGASGAEGNDGSNSIRWAWNTGGFIDPGEWGANAGTFQLATQISFNSTATNFVNASAWLGAIQAGDVVSVYAVGASQNFGVYVVDSVVVAGGIYGFNVTLIAGNGIVNPSGGADLVSFSYVKKGLTGSTGLLGSTGPQGFIGATGSGATGPAGAGSTGATGPQGFVGATGSGGGGGTSYAVRLDYDTSSVVASSQVLTGSPWTSSGLTVTLSGSNLDVKFQFSNELTPPRSIIGYFYNANDDKYFLTTFGLGSNGYAKSTVLSSTVSSNQASNTFFTGFGSFQIQLDVTPTNYGGAKKNVPPVFVHSYIVFLF